MVRLGYNYRMPDINASLGISQLKKIKKFISKRKSIAKDYFRGFRNNKNIILPFIENFCDHSFHLFPIQIKFKNLKINNSKVFKSSFNRPNLFYEVRGKNEATDLDLIKFIKSKSNQSGIIYCLSRKKVEDLSKLLNINGINSLPYHAGLEKKISEKKEFLKQLDQHYNKNKTE